MKRKNANAVALGKRSAKGRMSKLTAKERSAIARNAAIARWARRLAADLRTPKDG